MTTNPTLSQEQFKATENDRTHVSDYSELQFRIDSLLGKIGLEKTLHLLSSYLGETHIKQSNLSQLDTMRVFLVEQCAKVFQIDKEKFFSSRVQEYCEARMICYHLLKKYTDVSLIGLSKNLKKNRKVVQYTLERTTDRLSVPKYYHAFVEKYDLIESNLVVFLSALHR